MEISILGLIGIALATMFFGYFFGLLEGRAQGVKQGRKMAAEERPERLVEPTPAATPSRSQQQRGLLVLGTNDAGLPQLELDGRTVDALRVSPEQRRRLIELMVMLKPWVDPAATPAASPMGAPAIKPSEQAATQAPPPAGKARAPAAETTTTQPEMPAGKLSLVAQIDGILQAQLAGTPLAGRSIRLAESLHGGAVVYVGSNQYDGVDKVPEADIQAAIRAAIAEWEKRFTPG